MPPEVGAVTEVHGAEQQRRLTSYGVYSQGNLGCSGNKQFRMTIPPTRESTPPLLPRRGPEPRQRCYNGKATLDSGGELSSTFRLTSHHQHGPRYNRRPSGADHALLHVPDEKSAMKRLVQGAKVEPLVSPSPRFLMVSAGGAPNAKVVLGGQGPSQRPLVPVARSAG
jgi:hypothetical protein